MKAETILRFSEISNVAETFADKPIGERIAALHAADVLFTDADATLTLVARLAAEACGVPVGLVNFIGDDRQWTKAACGVPGVPDLPLDVAFCTRTIENAGILEIPDTREDERYAANPLVTGAPFVRYYAGATLFAKNGLALGTLCVLDYAPHRLTERQHADLAGLAALLSEFIAMRVVCEQALRSKLRAMSDAFEQTDVPFLIVEQRQPSDPRLCTYVNPAFERAFKIPAERIVGRSPIAALAGANTDPSLLRTLGESANRAAPVAFEVVAYDGDGAERVVELRRRPIPAADGTLTSWVISLRDLTEQRAASAEIARQAERMRALYTIANERDMTGYEQVDSVLKLGLSSLGLANAFVAQVDGESVTFINRVGETPGRSVGEVVPLRETWLRETLEANDVRTYDDLKMADRPTRQGRAVTWGSYIAAPVSIGRATFGAIGFLGPEGRAKHFTLGDREFVRLMSSYVGSSVERKLQKDKLGALAFRDALTGLCNRAMLFEKLEGAFEHHRRADAHLALHYIDLDGFKHVNDTAGHAAGDAVLVAVAERLLANVREDDVVARIGGDEFVVVQTNVERQGETESLADRLIAAMEEPFMTRLGTFRIGASIGIALHASDTGSVHDLLSGADRALYHAKAAGKGSARLAKPSAPDAGGGGSRAVA